MLVALYFIARLGGHWAENDTTLMTEVIRASAATGRLTPTTGAVYPQGYGYAAVSNFVLAATGSDPITLQHVFYPLISAFLVFPAWAFYRELTGSCRAAALGTLLLFVQPEFLFVALRGSHERMLRALTFVCLWLLVRSFRYRERPVSFAAHVALFYLVAYALIATNVLFGISFVVAIATALVGSRLFTRYRSNTLELAGLVTERLLSVTLIAAGLGFVFMFYVYAPSLHSLQAVKDLGQQLALLLLTTHTGTNPYVAVANGWVSLPVYFALGLSDYLLLLVSLIIWLRQGIHWLQGAGPNARRTLPAWILWLLYAAFAIQGGLAIIADRTSSLGGNLELRAFPSFAAVAVPLVAVPLSRWRPGRPAALLAGGGVALLAAFALFKATNEPRLSNKWVFYTRPEIQALQWVDAHYRESSVWVGLDERLRAAYAVAVGDSINRNRWDTYEPKPETRAFLVSDVLRLQSARLDRPLPPAVAENKIYDAGEVQLYRLRPRTPYQK